MASAGEQPMCSPSSCAPSGPATPEPTCNGTLWESPPRAWRRPAQQDAAATAVERCSSEYHLQATTATLHAAHVLCGSALVQAVCAEASHREASLLRRLQALEAENAALRLQVQAEVHARSGLQGQVFMLQRELEPLKQQQQQQLQAASVEGAPLGDVDGFRSTTSIVERSCVEAAQKVEAEAEQRGAAAARAQAEAARDRADVLKAQLADLQPDHQIAVRDVFGGGGGGAACGRGRV